ncbi:hypothetical protein [Paraburkholderia humisilvae]|uniref:hypothetical protein n=1 Tax=Paraburkholderia humisilvae TaxID=627669 RepID=UPI001C2EBF43|nr:hypothetical protein [Paraburkholderia humisilvae]
MTDSQARSRVGRFSICLVRELGAKPDLMRSRAMLRDLDVLVMVNFRLRRGKATAAGILPDGATRESRRRYTKTNFNEHVSLTLYFHITGKYNDKEYIFTSIYKSRSL